MAILLPLSIGLFDILVREGNTLERFPSSWQYTGTDGVKQIIDAFIRMFSGPQFSYGQFANRYCYETTLTNL